MNEAFLNHFLDAVLQITKVERGLIVDLDLDIVASANIDQQLLESPHFKSFVNNCVREAVEKQDLFITNNVITDPAEAPTTNTNFADLRVVVAIPLKDYGGLYFDQHIRHGVIPRSVIDGVLCLAKQVFPNGDWSLDQNALLALYEQSC